jgi:hypothetical protein
VKNDENNLYLLNILVIVNLFFILFFYQDSFPPDVIFRMHEPSPAPGDTRPVDPRKGRRKAGLPLFPWETGMSCQSPTGLNISRMAIPYSN